MITKKDILRLAELSRITVSEGEVVQLQSEIGEIIDYVGVVQSLTAAGETKQLGARYNVLRSDEITNKPGQYTADLLDAAPAVNKDGYVQVKQILDQEADNG